MVENVIIQNFLIAIALGIFMGLEREYANYKRKGYSYAGIRTFPLITLFGTMAAYFGTLISFWILIASIVIMGALIVMAYKATHQGDAKHVGVTSEVAGFIAFFIGVLTHYGEIKLAVLITVVVTIILFSRSFLHHFAQRIQRRQLQHVSIRVWWVGCKNILQKNLCGDTG